MAAANLPLDFERAVTSALAGDFNAEAIIGAVGAAEATERIELFRGLTGLRPVLASVRRSLALLAIARGFFGQCLRAFPQTIQCTRLTVDCVVQIAIAETVTRLAHFTLGIA